MLKLARWLAAVALWAVPWAAHAQAARIDGAGLVSAPRVDARGWLNPWRLRRELVALGERPGVPQLAAFNAVWRPLLLAATHRGDAVAEVVLRLCETADVLDRTGVASDCSPEPAARELALQRIDAIGWQPARHHRLRQITPDDAAEHARCADHAEDVLCRLHDDLAHYRGIHRALATGHLGVVEHWTRCISQSDEPAKDALAVACQRTRAVGLAVASEAPRFYALAGLDKPVSGAESLDLRRPPLAGQSGSTDYRFPFEDGRMFRANWKPMPGPVTLADFSAEVEALLATIAAGIDRDLQQEPRWAVFLMHRRAGRLFDGLTPASVPWPTAEEADLEDRGQPRAIAMRTLNNQQALAQMPDQALIDTLGQQRITTLWYGLAAESDNIQELLRRPGLLPLLLQAYQRAAAAPADQAGIGDDLYRFNLIVQWAQRLKSGQVRGDAPGLRDGLALAVRDRHAWVRAEAVSAMQFTNDPGYAPLALTLLGDPDAQVRSLAEQAVAVLAR